MIEWVVERALGPEPEPYDWRTDPRAVPARSERRSLGAHVDECVRLRVEIKQHLSHASLERYRDRKTLVTILILLAVTSGAGAIQYLASLFTGG